MPNEQERAERAIVHGKHAARMMKGGMSMDKVRGYIASQGAQETEARRTNALIGKERGYKTDPVPSFKKGGKVDKTGIYKLHQGEVVLPAKSHRVLDQ